MVGAVPDGSPKETLPVLPVEVQQFLERRSACDRLLYDFTNDQLAWFELHCANLGVREAELQRRYRSNRAALSLFHRLTAG